MTEGGSLLPCPTAPSQQRGSPQQLHNKKPKRRSWNQGKFLVRTCQDPGRVQHLKDAGRPEKPHLKQTKVVNENVFTEVFACTFSLAAFRYFLLSLGYLFVTKAFNYIRRGFLKPRYIFIRHINLHGVSVTADMSKILNLPN